MLPQDRGTHSDTVDVLEFDIAQLDDAILPDVLGAQLQGLRGLAALRLLKVHGAWQVDEHLDVLGALSWRERGGIVCGRYSTIPVLMEWNAMLLCHVN